MHRKGTNQAQAQAQVEAQAGEKVSGGRLITLKCSSNIMYYFCFSHLMVYFDSNTSI